MALPNVPRYYSDINSPTPLIGPTRRTHGSGSNTIYDPEVWHLLVGEEGAFHPLCGDTGDLRRGAVQFNAFDDVYNAERSPKGFFAFDGACVPCKEAAKRVS